MNKDFYTKTINNDGTYSIVINDGVTEIPDATGLREGLVYRSLDGVRSFKNVSNKYLLKRGE